MSITIKKDYSDKKRKPDISHLLFGKIPPQCQELEEAVLGAIMLESQSLWEVMEIIPHSEVFYVDAHQKVYAAILQLNASGNKIDLLTITEQLRKSNELELVGGAYFLSRLTMSVLSSAHVEEHARIVYEKYMLRELIRVCGYGLQIGYEDSTDCFEAVSEMMDKLQVISDVPGGKDTVHISTLAHDFLEKVEDHRASDKVITGITTGFRTLDEHTTGLHGGELTIIAARPSVGKTAFALNLAFNAVLKNLETIEADQHVRVCIFSMEMSGLRITARAIAFSAKIDLSDLNNAKRLSDTQMSDLKAGVRELKKHGIFINDTPVQTVNAAKSKARKLKRQLGGKWLWIFDYLQLIEPANPKVIREQQVSKISRDLKIFSNEFNDPVIALSQLNRDKQNDQEPQLSDLRESGAIEQDADNVFFLYKPSEVAIRQDASISDIIMISGAKVRNGSTFKTKLQFKKEFQLFTEPETQYMQPQQIPDNPAKGIKKPFVPPGYQVANHYEVPKDDLPF